MLLKRLEQIYKAVKIMTGAKVLFLDVENAPAKAYVWGLFDQTINLPLIEEDGYMLSWAAKWLGEDKVYFDGLIKHRTHFRDYPRCDKQIAKSIWKLVDQADIVVTHNGNRHDLIWLNTVFIKHDLPPVSPFKSVDTFKVVKSTFKFLSMKLEFLVKKLELGEKVKHEGWGLWLKCMKGDKRAWKDMEKYNKRDVVVLEKLYLKLRPFIKHHPNLALYHDEDRFICPNCGSEKYVRNGHEYTPTNKFPRYRCSDCGKNFRGTKSVLSKGKRSRVGRQV